MYCMISFIFNKEKLLKELKEIYLWYPNIWYEAGRLKCEADLGAIMVEKCFYDSIIVCTIHFSLLFSHIPLNSTTL